MFNSKARTSFSARCAIWTLCTSALAAPAMGQELKLLAGDGAANDNFSSIAINSGVVVVGAYSDDNENGSNAGAAYLFDAATGLQTAKLLPSDGAASDYFGISTAIENGVVAVGAYGDDDNGSYSGSVYLFDASTGSQIAKILPNDGQVQAYFGYSVAIHNGVVAVGAFGNNDNGLSSGSAYLFDAATGNQIAKLLPSDGAAGDFFGLAIAIDNGVVAVGAYPDDNENGSTSGSAYLFDAATGLQTAKLLPSDGAASDYFGFSIAIDSGVVAVGAYYDDDNGSNSGSAYLFDAATGIQTAKLLPTDGAADDQFGWAIAIDNGVVAVGTNRDDNENGSYAGSAYLFDAATGTQISRILPSDGQANDFFGDSIAIENGVVAVGANGDDDNGSYAGSAYRFDLNPDPDADGLGDLDEYFLGTNPLLFDTDGDGITDGAEANTLGTNPLLADSDADGVSDLLDKCHGGDDTLDADADGIPDACDTAPACPADMNGDGFLDNGDIITFVSLFLAGC
ncbi:MAG: hypothetical protein ACI89L_002492 [Phycisphaerales bacterium]|jgi:hypothetical protein